MIAATKLHLAGTHGIVPTLDMTSLDEIRRVVEKTRDIEGVVAYKLGLTLSLCSGLKQAARELKAMTSLPIIYDHQKAGADVPDMAGKFAEVCADAGVDALILFPLAGPQAVTAFVRAAIEHRLTPVVGGELPFADYTVAGGGYVADDALEQILKKAIEAGATHFVIPGNTAEKVRQHGGWLANAVEDPALFIPGIGALGGTIRECFSAAQGCRAYAVIGRAIYGAGDPAEAARCLAGEALRFA